MSEEWQKYPTMISLEYFIKNFHGHLIETYVWVSLSTSGLFTRAKDQSFFQHRRLLEVSLLVHKGGERDAQIFGPKRDWSQIARMFSPLSWCQIISLKSHAVDTGIARTKMSTVAIFSVVRSSTGSLSVSFDLLKKKKARQPCQFKYIVKYDTTDSAIWVMAAK